MQRATLTVVNAGPLVTVQDAGRPGLMRFGIPASGPMDRGAFTIANAALANAGMAPAIEISLGGLDLVCEEGAVTVAVAGGGFTVQLDRLTLPSWVVFTLRAGQRLNVRPGPWGSWTYLAFAGQLQARRWLGSMSTHTTSGFGGSRLVAGQTIQIGDAETRAGREGPIACPVWARPRHHIRVVLGPQERFFPRGAIEQLAGSFETEAFSGAVLTFTDLAPDLSPALSLAIETGLGLAFLSSGRDVGAGIIAADPQSLASGIFPVTSGETTDGRLVATA